MKLEHDNTASIYERIGGAQKIRELVGAFYPKVQADASIGHLFPEDITSVMEKQILFLTQFFGGPGLYTEKHGHPMMRARHLPFPITQERAEAWLNCMYRAMEEIGIQGDIQKVMLERLAGSAYHFVNSKSN